MVFQTTDGTGTSLGKYGPLAVFLLAGSAVYTPAASWAYIATALLFEIVVQRRIAAEGAEPPPPNEPPYNLTAAESAVVGRYRFYFTYPIVAKDCASILAALGLTAMALALWLTYRQAFAQALIISVNLFLIGRLSKVLAPLNALKLAAGHGNAEAVKFLDAHDPAWKKIHAANRELREKSAGEP